MKKAIGLFFIAILMGCTGMTYHPWNSTWKLGYTDTQLNDKTYRVSYAGYNIPQIQCDDFALMRAAEIAKERGFKYIRLLNESKSSSSQAFYMPGTSYTTGTVTSYGNVANVQTSTYGGGYMGTIQRPVSTIVVELVPVSSEQNSILIDADMAWTSLAKKYDVSK